MLFASFSVHMCRKVSYLWTPSKTCHTLFVLWLSKWQRTISVVSHCTAGKSATDLFSSVWSHRCHQCIASVGPTTPLGDHSCWHSPADLQVRVRYPQWRRNYVIGMSAIKFKLTRVSVTEFCRFDANTMSDIKTQNHPTSKSVEGSDQ